MGRLMPNSSVSELSGVGATRKKQLEKLGIKTLRDLIYLFPRAYERRGDVKSLTEVSFDAPSSVILTVASEVKTARIKKGLTISKFRAFDESAACEIVFFNSEYIKDLFHIGAIFRFYGKFSISKKNLQLSNPKYEPIIKQTPLPDLVPIYPLTEGLSSKFIDKITKCAIDEVLYQIEDYLPDYIRIKNSLPVLSYALRNIHFPENDEALKKSLSRLAFDEMMMFGIGISISSTYKHKTKGAVFSPCDLSKITNLLPYELTNSQKQAVNDIYKDTVFKNKNGNIAPMARILVGDVGSGKTICAILSMYIASQSGYQSALMAPTEILAKQHYNDINALFASQGIKVELLLGSTTQKEKKRIYESLISGETNVVIGTHALISDKTEFHNLGLIITDEQHRFGVAQRAVLKDKSKSAHLLVMSATPIPRTLALAMYGDLDVSRITEMPKGRQKVDTFVVDESYRTRLNNFILKQVYNGGQCYIVCPAIEGTDENVDGEFMPNSINYLQKQPSGVLNLKNIKEYTDNLKQNLPNLRIESLNGRMKATEKDAIMTKFSAGEIDVLVSTTVIEVGVNVPNASLMIVENADRFGLAQLHQLRGRVGRGTRKSYCILVSDLNTDKARSRLEIMRTTYDGYEIAEKDLLLRGPGDFFAAASDSLRQSGGFEFKLAKLCDDTELFTKAFSAAKGIFVKDPDLLLEEHSGIKEKINEFFAPTSSTIS